MKFLRSIEAESHALTKIVRSRLVPSLLALLGLAFVRDVSSLEAPGDGSMEQGAESSEARPAPPDQFPPTYASVAGNVRTLSSALSHAWGTEPRIAEAENLLTASGFDIKAAQTGYMPFAVAGARQTEDGSASSSLRIVQPLWNGGLTTAEVSGARAAQRVALAELDIAKIEVGQEVIAAYMDVVAADTQIEQWTRHLATLQELVRVINRRSEEGVAPQSDVQTAVSRLRQAEASLEISRAAAASNRVELGSLTGLDIEEVVWPSEASLPLDELNARPRADVVDRHPSVMAANALIGQQRAEQRRQKASVWPELQLQYRVDVEGVRSNEVDGAILVLQYESNNGLRGYRTAQAEVERERAARSKLEQSRRAVTSRIRVLNAELVAAHAQRRAQAAAVEATDVLLESFLRQFEVGRKSWVEVLNASREANETRLQAIIAQRNLLESERLLSLETLQWERLVESLEVSDREPTDHASRPQTGQPWQPQ